MRPRIAKRIVSRVQAGTATQDSYSRRDVVEAFRRAGVDLPVNLLKPWDDLNAHQTDVVVPTIDSMTRDELRAECKRRGLTGYSALNKAKLLTLLETSQQ